MVFRAIFNRSRKKTNQKSKNQESEQDNPSFSVKISKNLQTNLDNIKNMLDTPSDLQIRKLKLGEANISCAVISIEGIVDSKTVQLSILNSIERAHNVPTQSKELFEFINDKLISANDVQQEQVLDKVSLRLLYGHTIVYVDGIDRALVVDTIGGQTRAIEEPVSETLIRGPRTGFVENLQINLALIRREIRDPNLRFKTYLTGRRSKKGIVMAYVAGVANPQIIKEIERRLQSIDMDIVQGTGTIEEWIEDSFLSPFPQLLNTERPDKTVAAIMQGKVAILLEGTPFVLIAPMVFSNVLQSPEDYYERWSVGSLLRTLRYLAAFIAVFLPSLYIALISLQPGLIPSDLIFSISETREGVPFSPLIEAILMVITMELLQEAGARLPQTIGQTIGIVGGLVIGEAAVQAGIVSPIMVIVIALTAIATFAIPSYSVGISFRLTRFSFMIAAGIFGLYGIILVYIMVNIHMVNLKSFGVPYSAPFAPFYKSDWHDVVIRTPIQTIKKRPQYLQTEDDKVGS